jgi:hypothetical protein
MSGSETSNTSTPDDAQDYQEAEGDQDISQATTPSTHHPSNDDPSVRSTKLESGKPDSHRRRYLWIVPLAVLAVIIGLLAVPITRYPILADGGLSRQFTVSVLDSKTNTPVSGAKVTIDGVSQATSSAGKATFHPKVGSGVVQVHMQYYKDTDQHVFVGIGTKHNSTNIALMATGRQVPVVVMNSITGKPVADAEIQVLDTQAKTDQRGQAIIVLPTSSVTQSATISADGYNQEVANVQVISVAVPANTFTITPAGHVYFLSNQSGTIDVVSTNLDGSGRQTVLAGTGNEDAATTALMAAHDWKYLALLSKRDGGQHAKLFIINTATGQTAPMDTDTADFTPIGWSGHYFVYEATLANNVAWQSGQTVLRSYNADTGKVVSIDQTIALGTNTSYIYDYFGFADIVNDRVVYGFGWNDFNSNYAPNNLGGQKIMLLSASVDGTSKQDIRDIAISNGTTYASASAVQYAPQTLYIQTALGSQSSVYYTYQYQNNTVTQSSTITDASFSQAQQNHTAYLISPSGSATLWEQQRDGANTLFVGDATGSNGMQATMQGSYAPYAWFTDAYLLVQQNNSQLYIMPASGGTAQKISDYYHSNDAVATATGLGNYGDI